MFIVLSKWNATKNRDYVRQSFGRINSLFLSLTYQTIFLFNLPEVQKEVTQIEMEQQDYQDLCITNVQEINNNTDIFKIMSAFQWISASKKENLKYLVKIGKVINAFV